MLIFQIITWQMGVLGIKIQRELGSMLVHKGGKDA